MVIKSLEHLKNSLFSAIFGQTLVVIRSREHLKKTHFNTIFGEMLVVTRSLEKLKTRLPKDPWELPGHIWLEIPISSWEPFWNLLCAELRNGALDLEMVPWTSKWSPGARNGALELELEPWTSKWNPGPRSEALELGMKPWSSKWSPGLRNGIQGRSRL